MKIRIKFSKTGPVKFIGHLDIMRFFQKAIRRAGIDIAYSSGYSPHQIMSFAAPLSVGHTSTGEYFDIELNSFTGEEDIKSRLNQVMAAGIEILAVARLDEKKGNAMACVAAADYLVRFRDDCKLPLDWEEKLMDFYHQESIPVTKKTKRGEKEIDLKAGIYSLEIREDHTVYLWLNAGSGDNIKPGFVLETFFKSMGVTLPPYSMQIHRLETYQRAEGEPCHLEPLIVTA